MTGEWMHIEEAIRERAGAAGSRDVFRYRDPFGKYQGIGWDTLTGTMDEVAMALLSMGYGPFSRIGIVSDNRPEWTIADLGILSIRGIVVPFFSSATAIQILPMIMETRMELLFIGDDNQIEKASWLLTHSDTLKTIVVFSPGETFADPRFVRWTEFLSRGRNTDKAVLLKIREGAADDDLATIIYTSGTTGEPKGVMLDHRNFLSCFSNHDQRLEVKENDVSLCFLPLSHIFERAWTYYMMVCGAVNTYLENPRMVIDAMKEVRPTLMCTVPRFFDKTHEGIQAEYNQWSAFKRHVFDWSISIGMKRLAYVSRGAGVPAGLWWKYKLADRLVFGKLQHIFGGRIRYMPCAGAAIKKEILQFFHAAGIFINYGYGATETTATVSCFKTDQYSFDSCGSIMPGVSVIIGSDGEICVRGETVFRGYYRKPDETAKVLRSGWYHSGDKGYLTGADYLVMTDRIKDIFKTSGGKFISPQAIEMLISQLPVVEQIMVIGDNRKFLTALIVPSLNHLRTLTAEWHLESDKPEELIRDPRVLHYVKQEIERISTVLSPFEHIVRFTLIPEPFTIDNNMMTSTLKVKRQHVLRRYFKEIERMYER